MFFPSLSVKGSPLAIRVIRPLAVNRTLVLAVMCLALVMVVAGVSMLANALPSIAADLDASQSSQQWIVDAYTLVFAALILAAGSLSDRRPAA